MKAVTANIVERFSPYNDKLKTSSGITFAFNNRYCRRRNSSQRHIAVLHMI